VPDLPLLAGTRAVAAFRVAARQVRLKLFWLRHDASQPVEIPFDGGRLLLPPRYVEHYIVRRYEPLSQQVLTDFLRHGMVFADIGAHIGSYTVLAARAVGARGRVHAVEPWPGNVDVLRTNVKLNDLGNVLIHPLAAGSRRERRVFNVTGASDSHGFYEHPRTGTVEHLDVEVVPVDELVSGHVDAIKIDVEGAELEVLAGMARLLSESPRPALLVEWNPECLRAAGVCPEELPALLRDLGFSRLLVLDDERRRRLSVEKAWRLLKRPLWYANIWALPD
jgi:FkbM family methyltransferase